jgi:hypothetical protein
MMTALREQKALEVQQKQKERARDEAEAAKARMAATRSSSNSNTGQAATLEQKGGPLNSSDEEHKVADGATDAATGDADTKVCCSASDLCSLCILF